MSVLFEQRTFIADQRHCIYWVGHTGGGAVAYQMCVGSNLFKRKECFITDAG